MKQAFKSRKPRKYIGKYQPRMADGLEKASGRAEYLDDVAMAIRFPGMLHAKILKSKYPHAKIKSLDSSKAEALPGVHGILRYDDPEVVSMKPTSHAWTSIVTTPYDRYTCVKYIDRKVLGDRFCYVGDKNGVLIAAESEEIAEEALKLLDIEWEILPFSITPDEAMQPDAYPVHPDFFPDGNIIPAEPRGPGDWEPIDGNEMITKDTFFIKGDAEKALEEAEITVEVSAAHHRADHGCLDSMGCMIYWEGEKLVCHTNSYQADQTRMMIATMLDMPLNKVQVICPYVGASMGRWNVGDQTFFIYTALLAKRVGRPIKFKHTRNEDFHDTRLKINWSCRLGATKDGTITAAAFNGLADLGAYAQHVGYILKYIPVEIYLRIFGHIPNLKLEGIGVYTNTIPGGMMRCTGNIQFNLILGLAIDALAEKLDMEPFELVLKNFGHQWGTVPNRDLEAVLREGGKSIGWERRGKPGEGPLYDRSKKRGLGFSFHMGWHAEWEEELRGHNQVGVKVNPDLTVNLLAPTVETGTGSSSCNVYACAEALSFLGITPKDISWVSKVDTETGYKDCVQTDSAVSYLQPELMGEVGEQVKAKVLEIAAPHFSADPEVLDIEDGVIFDKQDPQKTMTVRELLWLGDMVPILVTVSREPDCSNTGVPYMAGFSEVEVDLDTGQVEVLKLVIVNDCGTVMFASGAEAQQIGGQCIGLGESLSEEIVIDPATGAHLNMNWIDYKIPTIADFPEIVPVLMEVWKGAGEYGACGIGESVFTCTPSSISNAIYNAVGVRINEIPFTPQKILKALGRTS